jgi:Domain of unknown function (DUF4158)
VPRRVLAGGVLRIESLTLKFFQQEGRFPRLRQEVPLAVVKYLARQAGVARASWNDFLWQGRAIEYHRAQIREFLGFPEVVTARRSSRAGTRYCRFVSWARTSPRKQNGRATQEP